MAAYRMSLQDARDRNFVLPHELIYDPETETGTVWSFRFKEAAGTDWTSWDPWYRGNPCRKMVFLSDGRVKEYRKQDNGSSVSDSAVLDDDPFAEHMETLFDPPVAMSWRYVSRPLDMPSRSQGSYIRFSVAGRDVPTYCVQRSPTKNWGFIMESCWGVYASFELPKRVGAARRRRVRLRRAQDAHGNWFNVEVEASDDETDQQEGTDEARSPARMLVDDSTFSVSSGLQWREALMYNYGARSLPDGEEGIEDFERIYAMITT